MLKNERIFFTGWPCTEARVCHLLAVCCLCAGLLICLPRPVAAHRVNIFAFVDGQTIQAECRFSRAHPARGEVDVLDSVTGKRLFSGKTDDNGIFRVALGQLDLPNGHGVRLHLNAGEGHESSWELDAEEFALAHSQKQPAKEKTGQAESVPPAQPIRQESGASGNVPTARMPAGDEAMISLSRSELEALIAEAVDKGNAPLKRLLLQQSQAGPSLKDIIGGIGWILGLFGIAAFFARKR